MIFDLSQVKFFTSSLGLYVNFFTSVPSIANSLFAAVSISRLVNYFIWKGAALAISVCSGKGTLSGMVGELGEFKFQENQSAFAI